MTKKLISKIPIGKGVYGQEIYIPVLKMGDGKPILTLICGIHGNETSGLFVLYSFLKELPQEFEGTINIIPSANPLAQLSNFRIWIADPLDLNRIIPGEEGGSLTERIAFQLFNFVKNSDCVIDFHVDQDAVVPYGIFLASGEEDVQTRSLEYLCAYSPQYIWVIRPKPKQELKYFSALGPQLCMEGIANFAVELPPPYRLKDEVIDKQVRGINNVMIAMHMIKGEVKLEPESPVIGYRRCKRADEGGIFIPQIELEIGKQVEKEDVIGEIICIHDFEKRSIVKVGHSGKIIAIKGKNLVNVGDELCCVIEKELELQKRIEEIRTKKLWS
ncbi:MAG: succinylglutamate desuccinylase/aspartoacylase family protein [Thermofilaceae archaeon]